MLRASAPFVVLRLAAEQISSSRFSAVSVCGCLAVRPAPAQVVLSFALRRTASAHLDAPPSLYCICIGSASAATACASLQVDVSKARQSITLPSSFFCPCDPPLHHSD